MFLQQLVNGLTLGSLYAVLAIGLTLVFGVLNIINMAHGGIFMIGAFVGLFMVTVFDVNIFVALIVAMAVGAILGYLLEFVALRPLRKKKVSHLAPLISTIGVSIFLESLALLLWGPQTRSFPPDYIGGLIDFGAFKISMVQIIGLGVSIVLMLILNIVIKKTKIGKAIRAVSMSTETAALLGINPTMIISVTVMIASALGAAAGVLVGLSFNAIEPTMGVIIGFKGLAVLILGGLGNITGAMVGGFILGVAEIFSVDMAHLHSVMLWPLVSSSYYYSGAHKACLDLKIKGGDHNGFIEPVLSTDRDVFHHQCHHGYFNLFHTCKWSAFFRGCWLYERWCICRRYPFFES